jgi:threonine aldolase
VGVDVLCFGGTKNGMPVGEAVVFFRRDLAAEFAWRCKQAGQLASKMRFLAAPWVGLLQTGAWLRHASHANQMAARLTARLRQIPGIQFLSTPQVNSVFLELPPAIIEALRQHGWKFYTFIGQGGIRLMCSWDTTADDVDALADDLTRLLSPAPA